MTEDSDDLATRLANLTPAARQRDTSAVRRKIRDTFKTIAAARDRGVTWAQITEVLAADGARTSDGTIPTQHEVRALYHLERYSQGGKRKRRKGSAPGAALPTGAPEATPAGIPEEVQERPAEAFPPATPRSPVQPARPAAVTPKPTKIDADDAISRFLGKPKGTGVKMPPIPEPEDD